MKVLMISIDKGLLGKGQTGDVIERHREYGRHIEKLDIIVFSKKGFEKYQISENVTAYPTNSRFKLKYICNAKKIGKDLFGITKYDLIITQTPFLTGLVGWKLKKKFGAKLLVHFHGDFWQNQNWLKEKRINRILLKISKFVVKRADAIRVMSEGQKEKLGGYKNKAKVVSTPVDLEKYKRLEVKDQKSRKVVLHVGRYDKVKDLPTLNKAWQLVGQKNSDVDFIQAGGGQKAEQELSDVSVTVHSIVDHRGLVDFFHNADVLVLSSTSESFGKVLVEANACGKPVVSTATTGAKEIIQDGVNGFLVPIGDAEKLADKILYLLNNSDRAKEMGERGRELVKEKYGDNTQKIINFWKEIVS